MRLQNAATGTDLVYSTWCIATSDDTSIVVEGGVAGTCKIDLLHPGRADVAGAYGGAVEGAIWGSAMPGAGNVGGAIAGGVVGASGASLYNLANQLISCKFKWRLG